MLGGFGLFAIAVVTTAVKWVGALVLFRPYELNRSAWHFGYEVGHIAGNLAVGRGFSILGVDGEAIPTAWASPIYPLLLSVVFRFAGAYTPAAAEITVAMNAVFQGLTAIALFYLGHAIGGRRVGALAVLIFLVSPNGWQFLGWAWPSQLLALAIAVHFAVLCAESRFGVAWPAAAGASLALAMLIDGAAIAILPITALVLFSSHPIGRATRSAAIALFAFCIVLAPWAVRNQLVLGVANPLRGNVGVNLWVGNHPGNRAESFHGIRMSPWHNPVEGNLMREQGELAYDRISRERALMRIGAEPSTFIADTAYRFSGFFIGEWWVRDRHIAWPYSLGIASLALLAAVGAWRGRHSGVGALVLAAVLFAVPYALTVHGHGRYRVPIDPLLCVLAALAFLGNGRGRATEAIRTPDAARPG